MNAATKPRHWHVDTDADGIAWLHLDKADGDTNVLSREVLLELDDLLDELTRNPPRGAIFVSDKPSGFIAGADVQEFTKLQTEDEALEAIRRGQGIMDRIEALPCPTVAVLHGFALGGGLELALACDYRVAEDDPGTKLGLPEIRLGIHPGFGGTVRSIERLGVLQAMNLMLTGRNLSARAAKRIRLVDYAVPKRHLHTAARACVIRPPQRRPLPFGLRLLNARPLRPWVAKMLRREVAKKARKDHYPAPWALIDLWVRHFDDRRRMLEAEAASVARLMTGRTSRNLVRVFGLQEKLKALGKQQSFEPAHVHVVGGGVMGGDIAAWCAMQGFPVSIQDREHETLGRVVKRAFDLYRKKLKPRRNATAALDRLMPDLPGHGLRKAELVIEAIFEDAQVKRDLFAEVEPRVPENAILATNTSSIPLQELAPALKRADRLVGMHFFNPVAKMPLVEIVHGPATSADTIEKASAFARRIRRLPLPVTSTPGFLVNRVLMPYLMEAVVMVEEGIPLAVIDRVATDFGMPMGPIELADTVGLDICLKVAENLTGHFGGEVPGILRDKVQQGRLGKKSGEGFYVFRKGRPVKPAPEKGYSPPTDLQDRLILRLLNEVVACLREQVVADGDLADAGIVFGTGFAPFRGGPVRYIHERGPRQLHALLESLSHSHGERFTPDAGWQKLVEDAPEEDAEERNDG